MNHHHQLYYFTLKWNQMVLSCLIVFRETSEKNELKKKLLFKESLFGILSFVFYSFLNIYTHTLVIPNYKKWIIKLIIINWWKMKCFVTINKLFRPKKCIISRELFLSSNEKLVIWEREKARGRETAKQRKNSIIIFFFCSVAACHAKFPFYSQSANKNCYHNRIFFGELNECETIINLIITKNKTKQKKWESNHVVMMMMMMT